MLNVKETFTGKGDTKGRGDMLFEKSRTNEQCQKKSRDIPMP